MCTNFDEIWICHWQLHVRRLRRFFSMKLIRLICCIRYVFGLQMCARYRYTCCISIYRSCVPVESLYLIKQYFKAILWTAFLQLVIGAANVRNICRLSIRQQLRVEIKTIPWRRWCALLIASVCLCRLIKWQLHGDFSTIYVHLLAIFCFVLFSICRIICVELATELILTD